MQGEVLPVESLPFFGTYHVRLDSGDVLPFEHGQLSLLPNPAESSDCLSEALLQSSSFLDPPPHPSPSTPRSQLQEDTPVQSLDQSQQQIVAGPGGNTAGLEAAWSTAGCTGDARDPASHAQHGLNTPQRPISRELAPLGERVLSPNSALSPKQQLQHQRQQQRQQQRHQQQQQLMPRYLSTSPSQTTVSSGSQGPQTICTPLTKRAIAQKRAAQDSNRLAAAAVTPDSAGTGSAKRSRQMTEPELAVGFDSTPDRCVRQKLVPKLDVEAQQSNSFKGTASNPKADPSAGSRPHADGSVAEDDDDDDAALFVDLSRCNIKARGSRALDEHLRIALQDSLDESHMATQRAAAVHGQYSSAASSPHTAVSKTSAAGNSVRSPLGAGLTSVPFQKVLSRPPPSAKQSDDEIVVDLD